MNIRVFVSLTVLGVCALFLLTACGSSVPTTVEEIGREAQKRTLSDFDDGFRNTCESRGFGRFTGGLSDDICECALRIVREEVTEDELLPLADDGFDIPDAIEQRSLDVCLGEGSD